MTEENTQSPEKLEATVLEFIARGEEQKKPRMRWAIIMELCEKRCRELRRERKSSAEISEESRILMQTLVTLFKNLLTDPPKITHDAASGAVGLTDEGRKMLAVYSQ